MRHTQVRNHLKWLREGGELLLEVSSINDNIPSSYELMDRNELATERDVDMKMEILP
jgi:hypothetical protein